MSKFRVSTRDEISRDELRRYSLRWALFASAVVVVMTVAAAVALLR